MNKRMASLCWKGALIAGSTVGTAMMIFGAGEPAVVLSYFTTQSNLLVILFFGWLFVRELMRKPTDMKWTAPVKFAVVVAIALTGLVYNLMLRPYMLNNDTGYDPRALKDYLVHTFTPLLALLDFVLFDVKGRLKAHHPLFGLTLPGLYWIYVLVYNAFGGVFELGGDETSQAPYFFMNVAEYGPWYAVLIAGFILLIGYALYGVDRLGVRIANRKAGA